MNPRVSAPSLSGPAGGVIGAYQIAKAADYDQIITFDMGGTSTDVSLCNSGISLTTESTISGLPIKVPLIDIHTVGAGGVVLLRLWMQGAPYAWDRKAPEQIRVLSATEITEKMSP